MLQPQPQAARPLRPQAEPQAQPPQADLTSGPGAVAPNAPTLALVRDGTLLLDRVGRLTRGREPNTWEFTLDADGRALADPPLVVLPNRKLDQLEGLVRSSDRDVRLRVSGEVTEYRGRNFLLLQRWVQVPDMALPLQ